MPRKKQIKNEKTKQTTNQEEFLYAGINNIHPSATIPQEHRRRRFNENNISELAESIRQKGIIEPLVVRRNAAGG